MMEALTARDAFDFVIGEWSFERVVPGVAKITGVAVVERRQDGTALYREAAQVVLDSSAAIPASPMRASQRYVYRQTADGFDVYFADTDKLFEEVRFAADDHGGLKANALHVCRDDVYRSEYALRCSGTFHVTHVVRGPRKDYEVTTVYRRTV